jgi:hypothetical protein
MTEITKMAKPPETIHAAAMRKVIEEADRIAAGGAPTDTDPELTARMIDQGARSSEEILRDGPQPEPKAITEARQQLLEIPARIATQTKKLMATTVEINESIDEYERLNNLINAWDGEAPGSEKTLHEHMSRPGSAILGRTVGH